LGDRCARVLGVAAMRRGDFVWHVYEDLGNETLAARADPERVRATVDLIAELHTRAANHHVLPDVRRYAGHLGVQYFIANVRDAIAALDALADATIEPPPEYAGVAWRLLDRLVALRDDAPRRTRVFEEAAGPDTLLHGDLWTINVFVSDAASGCRARLVDWDKAGVGPFSYDLSTFLFRFPPAERPAILALYREAVARAGWHLAGVEELQLLFDTAERARYANRVIWPVQALLDHRAAWAFPELAEVERWFVALDSLSPTHIERAQTFHTDSGPD
jgi:aminoglycoside phosphotransferase (APT) family kinase protein